MPRTDSITVTLSMLLVLTATCWADDASDDAQAIRLTALMKNDAVAELDPAKYAGVFAEDAILLAPGQAALEGRERILEWAKGWASNTDVEVVVNPTVDEIRVLGDWGFVRMTIARTIRFPDRDPRIDVVKTLQIQQRQSDGSWKIARDIWNSHSVEHP